MLAIGQERKGNEVLIERHGLTVPMPDDSALKASFANQVEIVPTIILANPQGEELRKFEGFGRQDWQDLYRELSRISRISPPREWASYPESQPGCGSKPVQPESPSVCRRRPKTPTARTPHRDWRGR